MPSILSLPIEIILYIAQDLDVENVSAFSRSCRAIHTIITPRLYRLVKDQTAIICWAADEGRMGTLAHLLAAGANPNATWAQTRSRSTVLRLLEMYEPFLRPSSSGRIYEAESMHDEMGLATDAPSPISSLDEDEDDDSSYVSDTESDTGEFSLGDRDLRPSRYYWSPLHIAAQWGNNDIIDLLLRYGANINAPSKGLCDCTLPKENPQDLLEGINSVTPIWTPLHAAICHGHEATARLLLHRGASTNVSPRPVGSDDQHVTALHTACYSDEVSISQFLLKEGYQTDVDVHDHCGSTPMSYAYFAGSWASIDFLVEMGASLNATIGPSTLLKHACYEGRFAEALRFIELGVDISASFDQSGGTDPILHSCCMPKRGNFSTLYQRESSQEYLRADVIRTLIKAGANLEARDRDLMTPLIKASLFHVDKAVEVFLSEGADINARDDSGDTALLRACTPRGLTPSGAFLPTVTALLAHMPSIFDTFDALERVCGSIVHNKHLIPVLQLLLHRGDPDILETCGSYILLLRGMTSGNFELCDALFEGGLRKPTAPEINILIRKSVAQDDSDALQYISKLPYGSDALKNPQQLLNAIKENKPDCAVFLIDTGTPMDCRAESGVSCLIEACKLEDTAIAELLLQRGADPNETIGSGFPLVEPILDGNLFMVELLLDHGAVMHVHPNGTQIDGRTSGALDLAIISGLEDVVETMVGHDSYCASSEEERAAHLQTACCAEPGAFGDGTILDILLSVGEADPDTVFPTMNTTPLHISMALGRMKGVSSLVEAGADIHHYLPPAESSVPTPVPNPFEGSTPLEWGIDNAPIQFIQEMLDGWFAYPLSENSKVPVLRYVRAACRRHEPEVMELLLDKGLDPNAFDEAGNPFLSIFCQIIDNIWPFEDLDWPASKIADRSASCVVVLLARGADPHRMNTERVSALDNIRRMMTYNGPCEFHQEVVRSWNRMLILDEIGVRERHISSI
ncbi:ankyrin [Hypoxylon sp. FL1857]|nr:ankyrin [Hypoxylon sp. FL1857]